MLAERLAYKSGALDGRSPQVRHVYATTSTRAHVSWPCKPTHAGASLGQYPRRSLTSLQPSPGHTAKEFAYVPESARYFKFYAMIYGHAIYPILSWLAAFGAVTAYLVMNIPNGPTALVAWSWTCFVFAAITGILGQIAFVREGSIRRSTPDVFLIAACMAFDAAGVVLLALALGQRTASPVVRGAVYSAVGAIGLAVLAAVLHLLIAGRNIVRHEGNYYVRDPEAAYSTLPDASQPTGMPVLVPAHPPDWPFVREEHPPPTDNPDELRVRKFIHNHMRYDIILENVYNTIGPEFDKLSIAERARRFVYIVRVSRSMQQPFPHVNDAPRLLSIFSTTRRPCEPVCWSTTFCRRKLRSIYVRSRSGGAPSRACSRS